jgi:hypothetical protein
VHLPEGRLVLLVLFDQLGLVLLLLDDLLRPALFIAFKLYAVELSLEFF